MSKIDCNITENYFKEKIRLCKAVDYKCRNCPLNKDMPHFVHRCFTREMKQTQEAIAIVQKWSNEHPVKTIKDDFLEKYPNAILDKDGMPRGCIRWLGYHITCPPAGLCDECWNRPLSEV